MLAHTSITRPSKTRKDLAAQAAEDEAVQNQLAAFEEEDSAGLPPWRQPKQFVPIQEKHRNSGQASSSSCAPVPARIAAEPAIQVPRPEDSVEVEDRAAVECVPPEHYSPVSEATEAPPPTDMPSLDEEAEPLS